MSARHFRTWRIGVCGSSKELPDPAVRFCLALGRQLARARDLVIVSGGTKRRADVAPDDLAADWHIVGAAEAKLREEGVFNRIETVVREDSSETTGFRTGGERRARGKTGEARRIQFVSSVDALVAVGGRRGTAQELALAFEQRIPVLPVPCFAGSARTFWKAQKNELVADLAVDAASVERWESARNLSDDGWEALAEEMVRVLVESLPVRCFVIMPFERRLEALFDETIEPVVAGAGGRALRVDRAAIPGDVVRQIDELISASDCAIAVLDGLSPNVLYELGLAHGRRKCTVLMHQRAANGRLDQLPFDLATQQVFTYELGDPALASKFHTHLEPIFARLRHVESRHSP